MKKITSYDFETLEQICKLLKQQGFDRLTPEQQAKIQEAEPIIVKPTVWHDHVGLKENIELVKITEVCYGLICNMECFVLHWNFFKDLVMIKD